jgi:hypothetical protein
MLTEIVGSNRRFATMSHEAEAEALVLRYVLEHGRHE